MNDSSGKYLPDKADKLTHLGTGLLGRWDWIMPHDGLYAYTDGTSLLASFLNYYPSGVFFEAGYGWMFNKSKRS